MSSSDTLQRQAALEAKLRALVAAHWRETSLVVGTFPGGAVARAADTGWVLADDGAERALGGALAWGRSAGVARLHVLAGGRAGAGVLARRASQFAVPPAVWIVEGRDVVAATPAPLAAEPALPPDVAAFVGMIEAAGAEAVVEAGILRGEVLGLEVARVVAGTEGARLEVGVGAFDREAQRMVHGDRPPAEALAAAVAAVREVRRPGAPSHEINSLAAERWLRSVVVRRPELAGASVLTPAPSPVVRSDLRSRAPAPAVGVDAAGRPVVAVCSTGIDVDLVPAAADARLAAGDEARLVLVVPEGDDHPITRALAGALAEPAEVCPVAGDWRTL